MSWLPAATAAPQAGLWGPLSSSPGSRPLYLVGFSGANSHCTPMSWPHLLPAPPSLWAPRLCWGVDEAALPLTPWAPVDSPEAYLLPAPAAFLPGSCFH